LGFIVQVASNIFVVERGSPEIYFPYQNTLVMVVALYWALCLSRNEIVFGKTYSFFSIVGYTIMYTLALEWSLL
jgi:7-cyano-7-deazaguanine synthase in queuosine biosynthesis